MRRTALAAVPAIRTPERQALADAILERDRRLKLIADKKAELQAESERGWSGYGRRDDLEEQLRSVGGTGDAVARRDALLRGEKPDDADQAEHLRTEIAALDAKREASRTAQAVLKSDVALLEGALSTANWQVERARRAVIDTDPATAALVEAVREAVTRTRLLRMVLSEVVVSVDDPLFPPVSQASSGLYDRLTRDADAAIPMPDEI